MHFDSYRIRKKAFIKVIFSCVKVVSSALCSVRGYIISSFLMEACT